MQLLWIMGPCLLLLGLFLVILQVLHCTIIPCSRGPINRGEDFVVIYQAIDKEGGDFTLENICEEKDD